MTTIDTSCNSVSFTPLNEKENDTIEPKFVKSSNRPQLSNISNKINPTTSRAINEASSTFKDSLSGAESSECDEEDLPLGFDEAKEWPDTNDRLKIAYDVLKVTKSYVIRQYHDKNKTKRKVFRDKNGRMDKRLVCVVEKCLQIRQKTTLCSNHYNKSIYGVPKRNCFQKISTSLKIGLIHLYTNMMS